jgi:hypothetical protein
MSGAHLCFYSARCRYSQAFLEELSRTPYAKEFRFICVDVGPTGTRPALPPYVKAVPTLMIAGEHEPRVDGAVMNWLSERRLFERSATAPAPAGGIGAPRPPMGGGPSTGPFSGSAPSGPLPDTGGLAGFYGASDFAVGGDEVYSFIGDNTTPSDKSMVRMTGNMAGLGDYGNLSMPDSRMGGGVASYVGGAASAPATAVSAKERAMNDAYEAYKAARDRDVPGPPVRR